MLNGNGIMKKKSFEDLLADTQVEQYKLKKTLSVLDLVALGLGAIIGTGIFVLTGKAAAEYAGPALILSFILAGLACTFAAISYAELASMIPISGSLYSYSYVTLGEFAAWISGWILILEYVFALPAIALGWSAYFTNLLATFGINIPAWATHSALQGTGGVINLPAIVILLIISTLVYIGTRESATVNNIAVAFKIFVVIFFILVGIGYIKPVNWKPFMPFGWKGVFSGASFVFFAYLGFDAVSTAAEETKNPERDLPIGILGSLGISTLLYILVVAILTGITSYTNLGTDAPMATAFAAIGLNWARGLVSIGALTAITTVLLVMTYGATRIIFSMSRDGLVPPILSKLHPKFRTPSITIIFVAIVTSLTAGFLPINAIAEVVNMATMLAFLLISIAVIILRYTRPDLPRRFKAPGVPVTPILAIITMIILMFYLSKITWLVALVWLIIGIIFYFTYSRYNSKLQQQKG
ncbi:MAG TPA: amino acid permease [Clostridia bacterium]|nr:amino acid permease [Clostridia bacterium]